MSLYQNWVDDKPYIEDYNPKRLIGRAPGEDGKANDFGYYRNQHGVLTNERDVADKSMLTGRYNAPAIQSIGEDPYKERSIRNGAVFP